MISGGEPLQQSCHSPFFLQIGHIEPALKKLKETRDKKSEGRMAYDLIYGLILWTSK